MLTKDLRTKHQDAFPQVCQRRKKQRSAHELISVGQQSSALDDNTKTTHSESCIQPMVDHNMISTAEYIRVRQKPEPTQATSRIGQKPEPSQLWTQVHHALDAS